MATCTFCEQPVDENDKDTYREVSSWVSGPKLDGPKLREQTGRVAHKHCVENLAHGQAPDQPLLITDEPGHVWKITGPNSLHEALTKDEAEFLGEES